MRRTLEIQKKSMKESLLWCWPFWQSYKQPGNQRRRSTLHNAKLALIRRVNCNKIICRRQADGSSQKFNFSGWWELRILSRNIGRRLYAAEAWRRLHVFPVPISSQNQAWLSEPVPVKRPRPHFLFCCEVLLEESKLESWRLLFSKERKSLTMMQA